MIKSELVQRIADRNPHLYLRDVEKIVNAILDEITNASAPFWRDLGSKRKSGRCEGVGTGNRPCHGAAWASTATRRRLTVSTAPPASHLLLVPAATHTHLLGRCAARLQPCDAQEAVVCAPRRGYGARSGPADGRFYGGFATHWLPPVVPDKDKDQPDTPDAGSSRVTLAAATQPSPTAFQCAPAPATTLLRYL